MESGVNTRVDTRGCYGIRDISRWRHMLITAPYQNNIIITRAHPTIILVTRDRLLLSASLSRYSGKLLRSCEKKRFEFIYIRSSPPLFFLWKFKFRSWWKKGSTFWKIAAMRFSFIRTFVFHLPFFPYFFLFQISHQKKGRASKLSWYFSWNRNRIVRVFRSFRFILLVSSRKFENFGKFRTRFHINSFRPRKKKKKTSRKVFA